MKVTKADAQSKCNSRYDCILAFFFNLKFES